MKRLILLCAALCLLTGCASAFRLENQAHAIAMGIDYENGKMTITVQVPSFAGHAGGGKESEGASSYLLYSASGKDFPEAINILKASLPQNLNLTHLKSIVFSMDFSKSELFSDTIDIFMNMFSLSGNAVVIVCHESASEFINNQKPSIGIRLSQIVPSMLEYHADTGFIPEYTLSMLYSDMKGVYSTGACALAAAGGETEKDNDRYLPGKLEREGKNKNEYMGAALFGREGVVLTLNGRETQLLNLLKGTDIRQANFTEPDDLRLSIRKKPKVKVDASKSAPEIDITLYLDLAPLTNMPNLQNVSEALKAEFRDLIYKCMQAKVDPFGFAEYAAMEFPTMREWVEYDWLEAFHRSDVRINVILLGEN